MASVTDFAAGGYRFIPAVFMFSGGVAASDGYEIERVQFRMPVPIKEGFARIESHVRAAGRPLTAFCACELRSPGQFTEQGFRAFNETYVETLKAWGLYDGGTNPVARSNVCPEIGAPPEPSFHAFAYTVPARVPRTFIVAGSAEAREGNAPYPERIVRYRDPSPDALREKALYVLDTMERRLGLLGFSWADTTATQVYTVHDLYPFLAGEIVRRGAAHAGLTWHYNRPPVQDLEYEMDCRGVARELVI